MNTLFKIILVMIHLNILMCPSQGIAESKALFWEVEKAGHKAYLMGSLHFGDESFYPLSNNIMNAFNMSSILYVEVDEQQISTEKKESLIQRYTMYPKGETVRDHVGPEILTLFEKALAEFGVPLTAVEKNKPAYIGMILVGLQAARLGYQSGLGIDQFFLDNAKNKKTIRQIESFEEQMLLLDQLPNNDAVLRDNFSDIENYKTTWKNMVEPWKSGNADALYQEIIAKSLKQYPNLQFYFEKLFFERNIRMAATAKTCIKRKEKCFIVVGAGHLVGKRGVVDLLQLSGYSVTQK